MSYSLVNLAVHVDSPDAVKVRFVVSGKVSETLWAEDLGGRRNRQQNVPERVSGISKGDAFLAQTVDGLPTFGSVIERGNHSTFRVLLDGSAAETAFGRFWPALEALGCRYEEPRRGRYAVDVPGDADLDLVLEILEDGVAEGVWQFEAAHLGQPVA